MTIANKASVDFKEFFGTVTSVADQEFDITCEAEKSRWFSFGRFDYNGA